ncbi:MAG: transcription termination factor Rho [Pseudomonadota bacterium]
MGSKKDKKVKEKPLNRMTAKELREIALGVPDVAGVHGMNRVEMVSVIKKARGIADDKPKKSDTSVRGLKVKVKVLKVKKEDAIKDKDAKKSRLYRRRISRLKKRIRLVA